MTTRAAVLLLLAYAVCVYLFWIIVMLVVFVCVGITRGEWKMPSNPLCAPWHFRRAVRG